MIATSNLNALGAKIVTGNRTQDIASNNNSLDSFKDVSPQDILKNLEIDSTDAVPPVSNPVIGNVSHESTISLIDALAKHFSQECTNKNGFRSKAQEDARHKWLKKLVYSRLLYHRKEENESSVACSEVENLMWMTHVFCRQRRFDDANSVNKCLDLLKDGGHLEANSDVRQILRFLVALKGCGEKQGDARQPAKITPRIVAGVQSDGCRPSFLPIGPLQYGDTFQYAAEHRHHYMHFPLEIFKISSVTQDKTDNISLYTKPAFELCSATPGSGLNPLIFPKGDSEEFYGKAMGAMLQERSDEMSPEVILNIPELPVNPHEHCTFSQFEKALPTSPLGVTISDEGYATRPSSRQIPDDSEEDIWEKVLKEPPLPQRRTWERVGRPPISKEKLFLSEAGSQTAHNIWIVYQELWSNINSSLQVHPLCVIEASQLCQDIIYLLSGVPSLNFPWCQKSKKFYMRKGLCVPGITPGHLQTSVAQLVECGTYVKRLEELCMSSKLHTWETLSQGQVYHAFMNAVCDVLHVHRGKVLLLSGETHLLRLIHRVRRLVRKIQFVSSLCNVSQEKENRMNNNIVPDSDSTQGEVQKNSDTPSSRSEDAKVCTDMHTPSSRSQDAKVCTDMPRGLNLIEELYSHLMVTKNEDYVMLLLFLIKSACIPFFQYLEDWIYEGICNDPESEFIIDVDSASLLHMDRRYWTQGYALRDLSAVPPFLREVLKEAFACGKVLNLLRMCSPKHYLLNGNIKHPKIQLCISQKELREKHEECQAYAVHMDYLADKIQISAMQMAEKQREEKQRLLALATSEHTNAVKEIERKLEAVRQKETERKQLELKELKEEMEKAQMLKKERIQLEAAEDEKIAMEHEEIVRKRDEQEKKLREKMEQYYLQLQRLAEHRETLARWKVDRCLLNEERKKFIMNYEWTVEPADESSNRSDTLKEEKISNMTIEVQSVLKRDEEKDEGNNVNAGCLHAVQGHVDYVEPSPTDESTSGYDMTLSKMSTSSDFVDTPHDENIPELEIDNERPNVDRWDSRNASAVKGKAGIGGNPFCRRKQNESYTPGDHTKGFTERPDNPKLVAEQNRQRVLQEEYGIDIGINEELDYGDNNANFAALPTDQEKALVNDDENGNLENDLQLPNANQVGSHVTQLQSPEEKSNANSPVTARFSSEGADDSNGNKYIPSNNEAFNTYQATRAQALAIKQKVLSQEFHATMAEKNNVNILQSKSIHSVEASANRQRVLDIEYGIADSNRGKLDATKNTMLYSRETSGTSTASYSRQTSGTSTSTYRSCLSYDRQTSSSTVFSTPDEERPVLLDQDTPKSPVLPYNETPSPEENILPLQYTVKPEPYNIDNFRLTGMETILNISGSALYGKPSTVENIKASVDTVSNPTSSEVARFSVSFMRSIEAHLTSRCRLVNSCLVSEVLVKLNLLDHFSALRSYLLLHDGRFARALIRNLCLRVDCGRTPDAVLTPGVLNNILSKSVTESCGSSNSLADNLVFDVSETPARFTHQMNILNCLELRYLVKWPHTLILDNTILKLYSRLWKFLASLHYAVWAADDTFSHTSFLSREDKDGKLGKCTNFRQICLYAHQMHHFLLIVQAYVNNQINQTGWTNFENKLQKKVSSLDELYALHGEFIQAIISRCFLNKNGAVVLEMIHKIFSLMLQYRTQLKSHPWQRNGSSGKMEHPSLAALQQTYMEFKQYAIFLHKVLLRAVERHHCGHIQDIVNRLDFNDYYSNLK